MTSSPIRCMNKSLTRPDALKARDAKDVEDAVRWAVAEGKTLEVMGRGTKRALGRPSQSRSDARPVGLEWRDIVRAPEELVLSAKAGTPLAEIEALVESKGQQLAFEPMDYGPIFGQLADAEARSAVCLRRTSPGSAADQGRRCARSFPRLLGGVGPRRNLQVRRPHVVKKSSPATISASCWRARSARWRR